MRIFKTWTAVNREWTTRELDPEFSAKYNGRTNFDDAIVYLDPRMGQDLREHKWLHEMVHVVANALGMPKLNENEDKVDAIAGMIHQIIKTGEGDYYGR